MIGYASTPRSRYDMLQQLLAQQEASSRASQGYNRQQWQSFRGDWKYSEPGGVHSEDTLSGFFVVGGHRFKRAAREALRREVRSSAARCMSADEYYRNTSHTSQSRDAF